MEQIVVRSMYDGEDEDDESSENDEFDDERCLCLVYERGYFDLLYGQLFCLVLRGGTSVRCDDI